MALRFGTLNANGLRGRHRFALLAPYADLHALDILFVQETHWLPGTGAVQVALALGARSYQSDGPGLCSGVAILVRDRCSFVVRSSWADDEGRLVVVEGSHSGVDYRLVNVYAPTSARERQAFLGSLGNRLAGRANVVLGGDFNCVEDLVLDKLGGNELRGALGSREMRNACDTFGLTDPFRRRFPNGGVYTWTGSGVRARLDRFYLDDRLGRWVAGVDVKPCPFSDHDLVTVTLREVRAVQIGPGYWKCNVTVLGSQDLRSDMETLWQELRADPVRDGSWWDHCKMCFRTLLIRHSRRAADQWRAELRVLDRRIRLCREMEAAEPGSVRDALIASRSEYEQLLLRRAEGARVRARVQHLNADDKPTRFFLRKEVANARRRTIERLEEDGVELTAGPDIAAACVRFYRELYTEEEVDDGAVEDFTAGLPQVSDEGQAGCEGPLTPKEVLSALRSMKDGKAPGLDGLPKEFYVAYFPLFGAEMVEALNSCYEVGRLSRSQRQGVVTLLCKDDERRHLLSCWRPITLLNVDYKLVSKVLCNRLRRVMVELIGPEQACAVPGRSVQDQLHLIRSLSEYVNEIGSPCGLVNLDQAKAFDRVSHRYLFRVLERFGLGPTFRHWVRTLYESATTRILVNGTVTKAFPLGRSVRQGCGLSPLLYVLSVEPLTRRLCQCPRIRGLHMPGRSREVKVVQYADDITVVIRDVTSIDGILDVTSEFRRASGSMLNPSKSAGMWLGESRGRGGVFRGISFEATSLRCLGIVFPQDGRLGLKNWPRIMVTFASTLRGWFLRDLTMRGRAVVAGSLACSKLWHVGRVVLLDRASLKTFESLMFRFVWKGGQDRVRRTVTVKSVQEGGLGVVDIAVKLKAFRIRFVIEFLFGRRDRVVDCFVRYYLGIGLRDWDPSLASNLFPHALDLPPFYAEMLQDFRGFVRSHPTLGLAGLPVRRIYGLLQADAGVVPAVCEDWANLSVDFSAVWRNASNVFLDAKLRELNWTVVHGVLPTNDILHHFDVRATVLCPLCENAWASAAHLFLHCSVVTRTLRLLEQLVGGVTGRAFSATRERLLLGDLPAHIKAELPLVLLLVSAYKRSVWLCRNAVKFDDESRGSRDIENIFLGFLRFRFRCDRKRCSAAALGALWGHRGVVVRHLRGAWVFSL